ACKASSVLAAGCQLLPIHGKHRRISWRWRAARRPGDTRGALAGHRRARRRPRGPAPVDRRDLVPAVPRGPLAQHGRAGAVARRRGGRRGQPAAGPARRLILPPADRAIRAAIVPAPKPSSMLTTATPAAQETSMASSAET